MLHLRSYELAGLKPFINENVSSLAQQKHKRLCDTVFCVGNGRSQPTKNFYALGALFAIHSKVFEKMLFGRMSESMFRLKGDIDGPTANGDAFDEKNTIDDDNSADENSIANAQNNLSPVNHPITPLSPPAQYEADSGITPLPTSNNDDMDMDLVTFAQPDITPPPTDDKDTIIVTPPDPTENTNADTNDTTDAPQSGTTEPQSKLEAIVHHSKMESAEIVELSPPADEQTDELVETETFPQNPPITTKPVPSVSGQRPSLPLEAISSVPALKDLLQQAVASQVTSGAPQNILIDKQDTKATPDLTLIQSKKTENLTPTSSTPNEISQQRYKRVRIPDLTPDTFQYLMEFFYGMNPQLSPQRVAHVLFASKKYLLRPLEAACVQYIVTSLTQSKNVDIFLHVISQIYTLGMRDVFDHILVTTKFLESDYVTTLVQSEVFQHLPGDLVVQLLSSDNLPISEEILWEQCVKWAKWQCKLQTDPDNAKPVNFFTLIREAASHNHQPRDLPMGSRRSTTHQSMTTPPPPNAKGMTNYNSLFSGGEPMVHHTHSSPNLHLHSRNSPYNNPPLLSTFGGGVTSHLPSAVPPIVVPVETSRSGQSNTGSDEDESELDESKTMEGSGGIRGFGVGGIMPSNTKFITTRRVSAELSPTDLPVTTSSARIPKHHPGGSLHGLKFPGTGHSGESELRLRPDVTSGASDIMEDAKIDQPFLGGMMGGMLSASGEPQFDDKDLRKYLRPLVKYIRFTAMSPEFFVTQISQMGILTSVEVISILSFNVKPMGNIGFNTNPRNRTHVRQSRKGEMVYMDLYNKTNAIVSGYYSVLKVAKDYQSYTTFAASIGYQNGIHQWKIKILASGQDNAFGIVTDNFVVTSDKSFMWSSDVRNAYFCWCDSVNSIFYSSNSGNLEELDRYQHVAVGSGDVLMIELDCDKWILRFYRNGERFGARIRVQPLHTYYPAITTKKDHGHYQIVH